MSPLRHWPGTLRSACGSRVQRIDSSNQRSIGSTCVCAHYRVPFAQREQVFATADQVVRSTGLQRRQQGAEHVVVLRVAQVRRAGGCGFDHFRLDRQRIHRVIDLTGAQPVPMREPGQHTTEFAPM